MRSKLEGVSVAGLNSDRIVFVCSKLIAHLSTNRKDLHREDESERHLRFQAQSTGHQIRVSEGRGDWRAKGLRGGEPGESAER